MKNNYQDVFKRYERKYMLTAQQYARLMVRLKNIISEDEYGLHTISNIYFDDDNFSLIRRSLEKPKYKEKLRIFIRERPTPFTAAERRKAREKTDCLCRPATQREKSFAISALAALYRRL